MILPTATGERRSLRLLLGLVGILFLSGCLTDRLGGAFSKTPEDLDHAATNETKKLIDQAYGGIDPARLVDYHTHILAVGTSANDAFINAKMRNGFNLERLKFQIYSSASGIKNIDNADQEYVTRLIRLARGNNRHGKYRILAFDKHYNADGTVDLRKTNMYIPNRYAVELAQRYSDIFLPVISVHPYRTDAIQELDKWGKAGMKYVSGCPTLWA